jgi:ATP-dependent DNA helicase RecG
MSETHVYEKKSFRKAFGATADLSDLAKTCVCLANAQGGTLLIGIENRAEEPPADQRLNQDDLNQLVRTLRGRAVGVSFTAPELLSAPNGGQYARLTVLPSLDTVATTSDGRVYLRLGEECQPVVGNDLLRLAREKSGMQWEIQPMPGVTRATLSPTEIAYFVERVRTAGKVSDFVRELPEAELLEYFHLLLPDGSATHLGVLWLGTPIQRARLSHPLLVQYIVYDQQERKLRKVAWLDGRLNPAQLLDAVLAEGVELRYYQEIPAGITRRQVRYYPDGVLRELLANAFAHRLYTTATDVLIGVYPDRLEITSPGGLPLGVTPANILHARVRRNPYLMATFQATGLMEGEGSGYDLVYEQLGRETQPLPELDDSTISLRVTLKAQRPNADAVRLLDYLAGHYTLSQRESIVLGLLAQHQRLSALALAAELQLSQAERLRPWLGQLVEQGLVLAKGATKGTYYALNPTLYQAAQLDIRPTLRTLEPHVLRALIVEDVRNYPQSALADIVRRIGSDVAASTVERAVYALVKTGELSAVGSRQQRRYEVSQKNE